MVSTPTKEIYFYHFERPIAASSLDKRNPRIFPFAEKKKSTDDILPVTDKKHFNLEIIICKKEGGKLLPKNEDYYEKLGETAKNHLLLVDVNKKLLTHGFIVVGNKSITTGGQTNQVSVCSTSRADLMAFHPNRSVMVYINSEEEPMEKEPEEEELVQALKGLVTENNIDADQQLFGGIEKELGLYMWCTRDWCNRFVRTPNCRDSRINHMFRNIFPMRDN